MSKNEQKAYLITSLHSVVVDYYRKKKQTPAFNPNFFSFLPSPQHTDNYKYPHIEQAMKQLSNREQLLLYYKYFMEYSGREISRLMNIKYPAVFTYLARARHHFIKCYEEIQNEE